jgi:ATP-dependent Clp protease ATP-binding subunit ClpB
MTSNLGSEVLLDGMQADGQITTERHDQVLQLIRSHFKPEFLNRIDDIIMFNPLRLQDIEKIVMKDLERLNRRLQAQEVSLTVSPAAEEWLADKGYEPAYGARPLQRLITNAVETPLAKKLISGEILPQSTVTLGVADGQLTFTSTANAPD